MQSRIAAILAGGFASLILIGTAGAISESYFEHTLLEEAELVSCHQDQMELEDAADGVLNCSVHRVSPTYARQTMASNLKREHDWDD